MNVCLKNTKIPRLMQPLCRVSLMENYCASTELEIFLQNIVRWLFYFFSIFLCRGRTEIEISEISELKELIKRYCKIVASKLLWKFRKSTRIVKSASIAMKVSSAQFSYSISPILMNQVPLRIRDDWVDDPQFVDFFVIQLFVVLLGQYVCFLAVFCRNSRDLH